MTIHGLWPSLSNGGELETCNKGQKIEVIDDGSELFSNMNKYWRSIKGNNKDFWEHEYNKHGYCYALKNNDFEVKDYFQMVWNLYNKFDLKNIMQRAFGDFDNRIMNYSYEEIKEAISKAAPGMQFELSCSDKNRVQYLKEIRFLFDIEFNSMEVPNFKTDCYKNKEISIIYE